MLFTKNMADEPLSIELVREHDLTQGSLLLKTQLITLRTQSTHTLDEVTYLRNVGLYNNKSEYRLLAIQALRASMHPAAVDALHMVFQRYKEILQDKLRENGELIEVLNGLLEKGERKSLKVMLNLDEPKPIQITFNRD